MLLLTKVSPKDETAADQLVGGVTAYQGYDQYGLLAELPGEGI